jgi:hypothetical protein
MYVVRSTVDLTVIVQKIIIVKICTARNQKIRKTMMSILSY